MQKLKKYIHKQWAKHLQLISVLLNNMISKPMGAFWRQRALPPRQHWTKGDVSPAVQTALCGQENPGLSVRGTEPHWLLLALLCFHKPRPSSAHRPRPRAARRQQLMFYPRTWTKVSDGHWSIIMLKHQPHKERQKSILLITPACKILLESKIQNDKGSTPSIKKSCQPFTAPTPAFKGET